ncbi:MAG: hypothetical protein ABI972_16800 [Acidobacteriota bacterium]
MSTARMVVSTAQSHIPPLIHQSWFIMNSLSTAFSNVRQGVHVDSRPLGLLYGFFRFDVCAISVRYCVQI